MATQIRNGLEYVTLAVNGENDLQRQAENIVIQRKAYGWSRRNRYGVCCPTMMANNDRSHIVEITIKY